MTKHTESSPEKKEGERVQTRLKAQAQQVSPDTATSREAGSYAAPLWTQCQFNGCPPAPYVNWQECLTIMDKNKTYCGLKISALDSSAGELLLRIN